MQYGAAGENVSLKKFRRQRFSSLIQCVNASDNQGGPVVGVRIDDADGALLHAPTRAIQSVQRSIQGAIPDTHILVPATLQ